jgi:hypothetical protein
VKLLLDQNLSPRLTDLLADIYPECIHVRELGMARASDTQIWLCAAEHGFTIVSKNADCRQTWFRSASLMVEPLALSRSPAASDRSASRHAGDAGFLDGAPPDSVARRGIDDHIGDVSA